MLLSNYILIILKVVLLFIELLLLEEFEALIELLVNIISCNTF